jgi:hypothetical protein
MAFSSELEIQYISNWSPSKRAALLLALPLPMMKFIKNQFWGNVVFVTGSWNGLDNGVKLVKLKKLYVYRELILTLHN